MAIDKGFTTFYLERVGEYDEKRMSVRKYNGGLKNLQRLPETYVNLLMDN